MIHSQREIGQAAGPGFRSVTGAGLAIFEGIEPVDRAGPSILIYHVK
jgi:hypothetical protein